MRPHAALCNVLGVLLARATYERQDYAGRVAQLQDTCIVDKVVCEGCGFHVQSLL